VKKIVIFEDNTGRQEALKLLLENHDELQLVGVFENCVNVVEEIKTLNPDLVLMDIDMPEVNGIEGAKLIRNHFPEVTVLMQTIFEDEVNIFNAIQAGAHGYILKSSSPSKLIEAITESLEGGAPMSPLIAKKVVDAFRSNASNTYKNEMESLTEKEKQILSLLSKGLSYKLIANECEVSYHTVNSHIKKIYEKLHVNSALEAVSKLKGYR
jgi:DNA-binding NarL/FixJ family response regulator